MVLMNVVRETREKLGWTQQHLAERLEKSLRTITLWEARDEVNDVIIELAMERLLQLSGEPSESPT